MVVKVNVSLPEDVLRELDQAAREAQLDGHIHDLDTGLAWAKIWMSNQVVTATARTCAGRLGLDLFLPLDDVASEE